MPRSSSPIVETAASPAEWQRSLRQRHGSRATLLGLLIFVVAIATMGRICAHEFVNWDDPFTIYHNPRLNPPTWSDAGYYWTHSEAKLWIPGTYMVWSGLANLARVSQPDDQGIWLNPWVFHTASVLLHALAALALFALLRRLLHFSPLLPRDDKASSPLPPGEGRGEGDYQTSPPARIDLAAALGAMLFAVHPVQVEAVAWASGLKDVLCGLMTIVALWQYVSAVQNRERRWQVTHYVLATFALAFGLLCKPTAMVVPAMAAVIDWLILRRPPRKILTWTALWWAMAIAIAVVGWIVQPAPRIQTVAWYLRPLVALDAVAFYVGKLVWPAALSIDYGRTPLVALRHGWLYITGIVPVMLAALIVWKPNRYVIVGALLFLIGLAPVLGLTRFLFEYYSTVADHYLYLPMIGVSLAAAWALWRFGRPWVVAFAAVLLAALALRSIAQAANWSNDLALFSHTISVNPNSFAAYNNYAISLNPGDYSRLPLEQIRERRLQAARMFRQAFEARQRMNGGVDDDVDPHTSLGNLYLKLNRPDLAREQHMRALEIQRDWPPDWRVHIFDLTVDLAHDDRLLGKYDEALEYLNLAAKMRPDNLLVKQERQKVLAAMGKK